MALVQPNNIDCKHDVTCCSSCGSALKIDPSKMTLPCGQKLSSSSPVQKNGSKTWTGEIMDARVISIQLLTEWQTNSTDHNPPPPSGGNNNRLSAITSNKKTGETWRNLRDANTFARRQHKHQSA